MTKEGCSGLKRRQLARGGVSRSYRLHVGLALGWALAACSNAGGGADEAPFMSAGSGGAAGSTSTLESNVTVLPPVAGSGGSGGAAVTDTHAGSDEPDFIDEEPEPEPEPTPVVVVPPSCIDMKPDACQGESCCKPEAVSVAEEMVVATNVSVALSPYALDKYEVTVGRFRKFLETYDDWRDAGNPKAGDGAHPYTPNSGWLKDPSWEVELPGSAAVMRVGLNCNTTQQTWTDEPAFNENKPINCVNWYEAFAFCAWDDARLPTEAEWQYAAIGGAQARDFAWGNTPLMPDFAVYGCLVAGTGASCTSDDIPDVGSRPDGDGRFQQADLNGSVLEWVLDWFAPYPELMRKDYAKTDTGTDRMLRGGCWNTTRNDQIVSATRYHHYKPESRSPATGFRCARAVEDQLY